MADGQRTGTPAIACCCDEDADARWGRREHAVGVPVLGASVHPPAAGGPSPRRFASAPLPPRRARHRLTRRVIHIDAYEIPPTIPRANSNYHQRLLERPFREPPKPLIITQPQVGCAWLPLPISPPPRTSYPTALWRPCCTAWLLPAQKRSPPPARFCVQGPSFSVEGWRVTWQQWDIRLGFNAREGVVLYNVAYHDPQEVSDREGGWRGQGRAVRVSEARAGRRGLSRAPAGS